MESAEPNC
uniref:Uncharacterized protein n=1 Tax=Rhizophora mucronata TaxID=61149 RepID=A0A2P2R125_RHIMU